MYEFHRRSLLAGEASVVSGFREFRTMYSTSLACIFSEWIRFSRKNRAGLGSIGDARVLPASYFVSLLSTDDERVNFPETRVY